VPSWASVELGHHGVDPPGVVAAVHGIASHRVKRQYRLDADRFRFVTAGPDHSRAMNIRRHPSLAHVVRERNVPDMDHGVRRRVGPRRQARDFHELWRP